MSTEAKTHGRWRGLKAFLWYGHVFLVIGRHGSWIKLRGQTQDFEPYTQADLMDPANRQDLKKIGGEYVARY